MNWGNNYKFLEARAETGKHTPAWENIPELYEDLEYVWESFFRLNQCRQYGYGPCPLLAGEILAISKLYDLAVDIRLEFFDLIKRMDQEWLKWAIKQNEMG